MGGGSLYEKRCKVCEGKLDIEGNEEYCSYCLPEPKKEGEKKVTKKKKSTIKDDRIYIEVKCTGECGKKVKLRIHKGFEHLYTPERLKVYKCYLRTNPSTKKGSWTNY